VEYYKSVDEALLVISILQIAILNVSRKLIFLSSTPTGFKIGFGGMCRTRNIWKRIFDAKGTQNV